MRRSITILALLLLAMAPALSAQETLLIENTMGGSAQSLNFFNCSQTFTMPRGEALARISVRMSGGAGSTLSWDLCPTTPSANDPAGAPLIGSPIHGGSTVLPAGSGYRWVDLDLRDCVYEPAAGEFLAIRMQILSGCVLDTGLSPTDLYPGGGFWIDTGAAPGFSNDKDLVFRVYSRTADLDDLTPYADDFEGGPGGWRADNGLWERGAPAQNFLNAARSGASCWMTDLDANYANGSTSSLVSGWFYCGQTSVDCVVSAWISYKFDIWNDGFRLEFDLDDGLGWRLLGDSSWYDAVSIPALSHLGGIVGPCWGGGSQSAWRRIRNTIPDSAGVNRLRLRFFFSVDTTFEGEGAAVDDLRLEVPRVTLSATDPYFEDFETPGDGWSSDYVKTHGYSNATGPVWERGAPTGVILSAAHGGGSCVGTNLDGPYPLNCTASLTSPAFDCSALTEDPVIEFALTQDFSLVAGADGVRVEVDLDDGNGFQTLGSIADWYDGALSNNSTVGGIGWRGTSNGWRILRHPITGAAGLANVRLRFQLVSNIAGVGEGCLVDDIRIFVPTFKGTESTLRDDIRMQVYVDGERELGASDAYDVQAGEQLEVFGVSPEGDLVGGEYYLVAEVFATGSTYTKVAPEVWISLGPSSVLLQGGVTAPFYVPTQMGPYGMSHFYYYGGGAAGYSCRVQALVFLPTAMNGLYASSDAFEFRFQ